MKQHWKILLWLIAGVVVGFALQRFTDGPGTVGVRFDPQPVVVDGVPVGIRVDALEQDLLPKGRKASEGLQVGDVVKRITVNAGMDDEKGAEVTSTEALTEFLEQRGAGGVATVELVSGEKRSALVVEHPAETTTP